ncbi:acyl-[ACP]--phospholipid O-acyltransferase [Campylobacter geochelonis]|uniref:2-acyl-glycerophospho-ethanolamine acyltransferase n=1 Tax=Campylobacter geochelonis TaxID=1780362 RepID=A0A128EGX0_9BACT|nr:acyl-[ACP]--phospholipid O-acyltransferase [Campylobacter geochelonis]QKF71951.1 2-acylglycerophosphoethanolamine acyltransferase / acyl-acyl carrier protein synthetase [Campylobacter geochelonis]CZE47817.1 2-acyl-glycerophospho-ethanolamine acyltransferase [Campylobacter geochelonis]
MTKLFSLRGFSPFIAVMFINAIVDLGHKITIQNILVKSYTGNELVILTAVVNLLILLPYVSFFSLAGFLNDKFSRTTITRYAAASEIFLTFLITISYLLGWFYVAFFMTLLLAIQSAIYSPAKYGLIKMIVGEKNLGAANGVVQAVTIISILLSSLAFSVVFEVYASSSTSPAELMKSVWFIGVMLFVCSVLETFFTFKIPFFKASDENSKFEFKEYVKFGYLKKNMSMIIKDKNVWLCTLGLSFFWAISQLIIAVFPAHYKLISGADNVVVIQSILAVSAIGLVCGSFFAGAYSKNHIELGLVPFGAFGLFISLLLFSSSQSAFGLGFASVCFGFAGGVFIVPLNANIQFFTSEKRMGKVLAGSNFVQNLFMILFLILAIVFVQFMISTKQIFVFAAFSILVCAIYAIKALPHLFSRLLAIPFLKFGYRVNVSGVENIPKTGGVLLLGNHISWIDWAVVQIATPRPVKFVIHRSFYDRWYLQWFFKLFKVIPIGSGMNKSALENVRTRLENGEVVALFPEGHISYNGQLDEFAKGFEVASNATGAKIVPFYIRGLWGSSFSRARKYFKNMTSKEGKRMLGVTFGEPMPDSSTASEVKQKVMQLSFFSWGEYINSLEPVQFNWLRNAKANLFKKAIVDSTGVEMNNFKVITAVLIFLKKFRNSFKDSQNIGLILPSSAMGSIINLVLFIMGKIPVNLNYTLSVENMAKCVENADIKSIVTSKKFIEKLSSRGLVFSDELSAKFIYLEEVGASISKKAKIYAAIKAILLPSFMIDIIYFRNVRIDDDAIILYSSGSEGEPKGVVLTHKNIMSNVKQISGLLNSDKNEVILASLPIFHSFGLTVTTYLPLSEGITSVHVADSTDGLAVAKMAAKQSATVMFGTSTFFRLYAKNPRINHLMFKTIKFAIAGAEKLKPSVKDEFKMKFGVDIFEGYGATETTPVVSVNMPNMLELDSFKELVFNKFGSVGLPLPGTVIKIVDLNTLEELAQGESGLILIGGHQVMREYRKNQAKTDEVIVTINDVRYYKSGDIGYLDSDGFLYITDRVSRFAKIGGEMVSLGALEDKLGEIFKDSIHFICVNLADEKKGEKIVMLYDGSTEEKEVMSAIKASNIPNLMHPTSVHKVEQIPLLGTGKADYKSSKTLAIKIAG